MGIIFLKSTVGYLNKFDKSFILLNILSQSKFVLRGELLKNEYLETRKIKISNLDGNIFKKKFTKWVDFRKNYVETWNGKYFCEILKN